MIRFSAALVAVAIGVLIGGIATSKLLLVYIAIVVSAVALVALAVGVVLKREELFGENQGLVPVGAGAGPVPSRVGASQGDGVAANTVPAGAVPPGPGPAGVHVAPPPPYAGAASSYGPGLGGTGFGGTAQPAPAAAVPSAPVVPAASSQGRSADPAPPWETPAARGQWQSPAADWMSAGQGGPSGGRAAGWGAPPAKAGPGSGSPDAGSGSGAPSWFERLGSQTAAEAPAARSASAPGSTRSPAPGSGWPWSAREGSAPAVRDEPAGKPVPGAQASAADTVPVGARFADAGAVDTGPGGPGDTGSGEDDDWPTRYSWLEDDADDSGEADGEAAKTVAVNVADMELRRTPPPPAPVPFDTAPSDAADPSDNTSGTAGTPGAAGDPADETEESSASVIAFRRPAGSVGRSGVDADEDGGNDSLAAQPGAGGEADALGEQTGAPGEAEDEPSATSESPAVPEPETAPAPEATLVTVVPGVPRYHKPDCVLIRFMPEGDVRQLPAEEAKDAGCTPCAACQPAK